MITVGLRLLTRYISWAKLRNFDGVLLRIHTLREGVRGNFGTITIALTLMWVLFTLMLLLSRLVIRRMVRNMSVLQTSLEWQAWHDALTRLLNRGALFEQAMAVASACQRSGRPLSVISSIWITSSASTIAMAIRRVTECCRRWPVPLPAPFVRVTCWAAWAGRSFVSCCRIPHYRTRWRWQSGYACEFRAGRSFT